MRFDKTTEKMADNQIESEANKQDQGADTDVQKAIRIPLRIDEAIIVRSLTNTTHMAKSRIIGAMHGEFILITEPTFPISYRISAILDDCFLCSYFSDGFLYNFQSSYRKELINDLICIEYPTEVEVRRIREHRRIKVNIETECTVSGSDGQYNADMADISRGGCRLVFSQRVQMTKETGVSLTFSLPNGAFVSALKAVVVGIDRVRTSNATEVGLTFTGPESELSKVLNFCEFCMFFDME